MLARRVKRIAGLKLKVELIVTDPHGELLGLWAQGHLYVLEIFALLKWSEVCRYSCPQKEMNPVKGATTLGEKI